MWNPCSLSNEKVIEHLFSWALQEPLACPRTQMQNLTRMDKGVVEGLLPYDNNGECELNESNTIIFKIFTKL